MTNMKNEILAGIVGGLAGAAVMNVAMMMGQKTGMIVTPAPLKVERRLEKRLHVAEKTTNTGERALATVGHYAIGGLLGAGYGVIHANTDGSPIPTGPLYGLGTYALNFMGLGPATGLMPGPWKQEPPDVAREMMMHVVFGAVTAVVADRLLQKMDGQQFPSRQDMPTARQVQEEFFEEEYHEEEMPERMP